MGLLFLEVTPTEVVCGRAGRPHTAVFRSQTHTDTRQDERMQGHFESIIILQSLKMFIFFDLGTALSVVEIINSAKSFR